MRTSSRKPLTGHNYRSCKSNEVDQLDSPPSPHGNAGDSKRDSSDHRRMPLTRDPNFITGHLCRFCGKLVPWGTILRLLRVDPDQPGFMQKETACHTACLEKVLRPGVELTFHRH